MSFPVVEEKEKIRQCQSPSIRPAWEGFHLDQFPRLKRMREALLSAEKEICVERARLATRYFKRKGFDEARPVLRQARVLRYILSRMKPVVFEDELIVGSTTSKRLGANLFPEMMGQAILPELPSLSKRKEDPTRIADREAELLANEVFPFWKDRTVLEWARRKGGGPVSLRLMERMNFYLLAKSETMTHVIPDYAAILNRGALGLMDEARRRQEETGDPKAAEFYRAVRTALSGTVIFARRYAAACERAARRAAPNRREELLDIARILRRVPEHPASGFHEALQSLWIVHAALHQENNDSALSFGRADQYLEPFYQWDVRAGRIDEARAVELIGCFFIKMGDHAPVLPKAAIDFFGGTSTNQALTVGGTDRNGADAAGELTHLMLKAAEMMALREPNLCARVHDASGKTYWDAMLRTVAATGAAPAIYGDNAVVPALVRSGLSLEEARDYGVVGCVEPTGCGNTMGMTGGILFNLASALETALHDGRHPLSGMQVGPRTGRLSGFRDFESFYEAFRRQLESLAGLAMDGDALLAGAHAALRPTPLLSALMQGTMENGRDVTSGGARHNSTGVAIVGFADVADSLSALKRLCFEKGAIQAGDLERALKANFEDHEKIGALLWSRGPKYGNDDADADAMAARLTETVAEIFESRREPRGGRHYVGYWSMTLHAGFGAMTGALPSGRKAGAPLASGATPVSGAAGKGPTASFASSLKLPTDRLINCFSLNHKFSKKILSEAGKRDLAARLLQTYFRKGGMQVQLTVQDRQDLIEAKANPRAFRDLLVRVSGYTAYFCDLPPRLQDEIIERTEDIF